MVNNIAFPRLGIDFNISPVAFSILGKDVYWYALIILIGFFLGLLLVYRDAPKRGLSHDNVVDIALLGIVSGIICARIYYVIFSWDEFRDDIMGIFRIWEGGIAIYGAIIGAVISTAIYCKVKKLNILNAFDVCCVGLLLGQAIGRWGNFVNCEVYGGVTDSIFGMSINGGAPVVPLFLYESALNFLGVILLLLFRNHKTHHGQVFMRYLFWYSLCRLILEGMRDTRYILYLIPNVLGISQFVSVLLIIISIIGSVIIAKSKRTSV